MKKILSLIKKSGYLNGRMSLLKLLLAVSLTVIFSGLIQINAYTERMNSGLADNLIRLHVIANSDSPEDQELKRDVRNAVLTYVEGLVENVENISQTRTIIQDKLESITIIARNIVSSRGKDYTVKTILGNYPFPTKAYGDITLPAGEYEALRVVIGDGEGANWWCVLFPPLCFVDVTHGTVPDSVKDDLKKVLTKDEYEIVTSSDEESDIPIKIKFKIVEMFQDSKVKLAGAIDRLFKSQG